MKIALTGATGFIGSHILTELLLHGHEVTALVREDTDAVSVAASGAAAAIVDMYDRSAVAKLFSDADGAVNTASPGDDTSASFESAVVDAAIEAFGSSGKPYAHISGLWVYGSTRGINEESPLNPPPLVAWKPPIERRLLAEHGMRTIVILSGTAYGDGGGGVPGILLGSPRDPHGNLIMLGSGQQHWPSVHVDDLAAVFRIALEDEAAQGKFVVGDGLRPSVAELTEAAAALLGAPGAVPGSEEEARARLGDYFAEVLLLDQTTPAAKVRALLGWRPTRPGLLDELRTGSYHV
jgi:nucleoside-diphosphate-sugar epimerase